MKSATDRDAFQIRIGYDVSLAQALVVTCIIREEVNSNIEYALFYSIDFPCGLASLLPIVTHLVNLEMYKVPF